MEHGLFPTQWTKTLSNVVFLSHSGVYAATTPAAVETSLKKLNVRLFKFYYVYLAPCNYSIIGVSWVTWENSQHLTTPTLVSSRRDVWETERAQKFHTDDVWRVGSASNWMKQIFNQSEALSRFLMIVKHVFFFMIRWLCEGTTKKMLKMSKKQR